MSSWWAASTLTPNRPASRTMGSVRALFSKHTSARSGSSDSEQTAFAVIPPEPVAATLVTTATPVANRPNTSRKSSGSGSYAGAIARSLYRGGPGAVQHGAAGLPGYGGYGDVKKWGPGAGPLVAAGRTIATLGCAEANVVPAPGSGKSFGAESEAPAGSGLTGRGLFAPTRWRTWSAGSRRGALSDV